MNRIVNEPRQSIRYHVWQNEQAVKLLGHQSLKLGRPVGKFSCVFDAQGWHPGLASRVAMAFLKGIGTFLRSFVRPFVPEKGLESEQLIFSLLSTMYGWPFIPDGLFRWMDSFIHSFIHCAAFFFFYGQLVRLID